MVNVKVNDKVRIDRAKRGECYTTFTDFMFSADVRRNLTCSQLSYFKYNALPEDSDFEQEWEVIYVAPRPHCPGSEDEEYIAYVINEALRKGFLYDTEALIVQVEEKQELSVEKVIDWLKESEGDVEIHDFLELLKENFKSEFEDYVMEDYIDEATKDEIVDAFFSNSTGNEIVDKVEQHWDVRECIKECVEHI